MNRTEDDEGLKQDCQAAGGVSTSQLRRPVGILTETESHEGPAANRTSGSVLGGGGAHASRMGEDGDCNLHSDPHTHTSKVYSMLDMVTPKGRLEVKGSKLLSLGVALPKTDAQWGGRTL